MRPVILLGVGIEAEKLFQLLIGAFRLSVSSGVKCHRGILFDAEHLTYFDGKAAHKPGVSVVDKCFGESYAFKHIFQVEFGDSFRCDCFVAWYEDDCFGAVVVRDCEY